MGSPYDLNVVNRESAEHAARLGDAHELIVCGILIRLGFDVHVSTVGGQPYDLIIEAFVDPSGEDRRMLKAQVKTVGKGGSVSFKGGLRGGVDREYRSGEKEYKYTEAHNDIIVGVDRDTLDLYLIPTRVIQKWGGSKTVRKMRPLRNHWDILLNWNDLFLDSLERSLPS